QFTGEVCGSNFLIPTNGIIYSCCSSNDGQYVFASNWNNPWVEVIETASNTIVQTIPTGSGSLKMRTSNNGQWVFCSNTNSNTVSVIDVSTLQLIGNIPVGQMPRNIALSPDDAYLYVSNWRDWTMSVIDTETWLTITEVSVDYWPQAVWALPNNDYVLVANFGFDWTYDHISVIRTSDWEVIARLQTGAGPEDMMSIGPNGEYIFVSNWGMPCCFNVTSEVCCAGEVDKGSATIIATPDFDAIVPPGTIPDPIPYIQSTLTTVKLQAEYSFGMDAHPDGTAVYVVNKDSDSMSIIGFDDLPSFNVPGDICEYAKELTNPVFCLDDCTSGYSDDYNESCPFPETGGPDLVYKFDPLFTQTVNIDLCTSSYDTKVYIYEGTCESYNSGEAIYCNDDFCGVNGWRSRLEDVTFELGNTYYIIIDGWGAGDSGNFTMCFENDCPGDMNGDLIININDLLIFLSGMGGQFDTDDLMDFLGEFGSLCN
ncbi:MAG: YncE family protein, partial [Flavobacteriales bacterium]|nr:YncE family protein [Flavobacteriales bacterium]